jgi:hypothetical protein
MDALADHRKRFLRDLVTLARSGDVHGAGGKERAMPNTRREERKVAPPAARHKDEKALVQREGSTRKGGIRKGLLEEQSPEPRILLDNRDLSDL